ncbi:MAG: hypothetical protein JSU69_03970 [Candidatus Zixiibacteriota bacterium]|nr:MAG: hypothetical protein JSU69_03970 [candidate division Zixibacteria bacterium]
MKVNSIGIEAYRQTIEKPQTENRPVAAGKTRIKKAENLLIPTQGENAGSDISVRLKPGTFVDMLSDREKQAMEMFFERFNGTRSGEGAYNKEGAARDAHLGRHLDVTL